MGYVDGLLHRLNEHKFYFMNRYSTGGFLIVMALIFTVELNAQRVYIDDTGVKRSYMLNKINNIRENGCRCGRKRMRPVARLKWNRTLEYSAYQYAKEMHTYKFFSHHSIDGKDIGERLDDYGYKWQYAGENLAEGQKSFEIALEDWMESKTHCEMLMNPDMTEMGLARYGKYWVNHFGAAMPQNTKRIRKRYKEGD